MDKWKTTTVITRYDGPSKLELTMRERFILAGIIVNFLKTVCHRV